MIQVIHCRVLLHGRENPEVMDRHFKITFHARVEVLKDTLANEGKWDTLGLIFQPVAEVDTDDLDVAFEKTNHIDRDWKNNDGVTAMVLRPRSTSVGDLMRKDGKLYVVAPAGFVEVV